MTKNELYKFTESYIVNVLGHKVDKIDIIYTYGKKGNENHSIEIEYYEKDTLYVTSLHPNDLMYKMIFYAVPDHF